MPEQSGDKSQDPTPHRRQQAREQGQVARSQDLGSAAVLLGGVLALMTLGPAAVDFLGTMTRQQLGGEAWLSADVPFATAQWHALAWGLAQVVLPILGV